MKQAIYFVDKAGFKLLDTMIYTKNNRMDDHNKKWYPQAWEFMFVFCKGKPGTFNPIRDVPNKYVGDKVTGTKRRVGSGKQFYPSSFGRRVKKKGIRNNVWYYATGLNNTTGDRIAFRHPALMPEQMAKDHILTWTNPGEIVLDPFSGAGTTAKMAMLTDRNYIGIELAQEYVELSRKRLELVKEKMKNA